MDPIEQTKLILTTICSIAETVVCVGACVLLAVVGYSIIKSLPILLGRKGIRP